MNDVYYILFTVTTCVRNVCTSEYVGWFIFIRIIPQPVGWFILSHTHTRVCVIAGRTDIISRVECNFFLVYLPPSVVGVRAIEPTIHTTTTIETFYYWYSVGSIK